MIDRAEFEEYFRRPAGVFWDNEFCRYDANEMEYELDADEYNKMFQVWEAACAQFEQDVEPDWSDSKTLESEGWKNPLLSKNDRLQIADGAIAWRDEVIKNLRSRDNQPAQIREGSEPVAWMNPSNPNEVISYKKKNEIQRCYNLGIGKSAERYSTPLFTQAQTAQQWTPSEIEYDRAIHHNPDAKAWADLFMLTFPHCGADLETMHGWFANAMMAMYDHLKNSQPAQQGVVSEGWKLVPVEPTKAMRDAAQDAFDRAAMITYRGIYRAMLDAAPQSTCVDDWVSSFDRAPTKADADFSGRVIWWEATDDTLQEFIPVVAHYDPNWWEGAYFEDFSKDIAPSHPFWKSTGLKRPQPPKEGE